MDVRKKILPAVLLTAALCALHAAELDLEKDFRQEIALYRIRPDQTRSLKRDPNGTPVSEPRLKEAVRSFYDRLYPLDPGFLKRFKIKSVVFKDTVCDRDGEPYQMYLAGDDLFVDADLDEKQFYANLFYRQLPAMQRSYIGHWEKLNPDGFSYEGTRGSLSGSAQKKLDAVLSEWDRHFVSRSAMYSPEMDMAQTFTYMVTKGPDAMAFAKKNAPDILKKFDMVSDILTSVKATERGYMETLLSDDLSKLKTYVPYALSVRLEHEYSGVWSRSSFADEGGPDGAKPAAPRKIGDPVEVAGRKVNPLILALETKNSRLFKVLMQNKADPNAVNDRKVSALMLAIGNNDPEQVKSLLDAGAKVTQEAARAGTASGVNAEIVNLMKSYLPGVRESAAPEKKAANRSSGETADGDLRRRLQEMKFERLGIKEADAANIVALLQRRSKQLDPAGKGIRIILPQSYSDTDVTLVTEDVSLYEMLQLVCKNTGLEMQLEPPNTVLLVNPKPEQKETGKKNGSAKGNP